MRTLLAKDEVQAGVARLADEITRHYAGRPLTILGVLTGSVVLLADLIRRVDLPLRVGVVQARSYRGASTRPSELVIDAELMPDIRGRDVLLLDDIFDTGSTLSRLRERLEALGPASVRAAVLLRKDVPRPPAREPEHVAFEIADEFVVGYGLDYRDRFRNLECIATLEPADRRGVDREHESLESRPAPDSCGDVPEPGR